MPTRERLERIRWLRCFGHRLYNPNFWHLNRRSVSRSFAIGLFWALIPMPLQMVPSAACAIYFRANIPLAVILVWLTNPLTMPPIYYANYRLGRFLMQLPTQAEFEFTARAMASHLASIWKPLYLGSLVAGVALGVVSYLLIHVVWRLHTVFRWRRRQTTVGAT